MSNKNFVKYCPCCNNSASLKKCDDTGCRYFPVDSDAKYSWGKELIFFKVMCDTCRLGTRPFKTSHGALKSWNRRDGEFYSDSKLIDTVDDLKNHLSSTGSIWIEHKPIMNYSNYYVFLSEIDNHGSAHFINADGWTVERTIDGYKSWWRCWTAKPSDAQREEVSWNA